MSEQAILESVGSYGSSDPPEVREEVTKRIKRNRRLVLKLKALYDGKCQYCGFTFIKQSGKPYSEAAHLRPLSLLEADLDVTNNLVVLCANHHRMLDLGPLEIRFDPSSGQLLAIEEAEETPITNKHIGLA